MTHPENVKAMLLMKAAPQLLAACEVSVVALRSCGPEWKELADLVAKAVAQAKGEVKP